MRWERFKAGKSGISSDMYTLLAGRAMMKEPAVRELTGTVPLRFSSDGSELLDWHIKGASGGVGKPKKSWFKETNVTLGNGQSSGPFVGTSNWTVSNVGPFIPAGEAEPQWLRSYYSATINSGGKYYGVDDRPEIYSSCQYKLTLGAGSYKLVFEAADYGADWQSDFLSRWSGYGSPVIRLMKSDNTSVVRKVLDLSSYYGTTYVHEEYAFTLTETTDLGLYFLGLGDRIFPRFMIVDSDTVAVPFSVTYLGVVFSGVTCWEPFRALLPVTVTGGGQTNTVNIDLGDSLLYENDTVTFTSAGNHIPTYTGANVLDADSAVKPSEVYIKYMGYETY